MAIYTVLKRVRFQKKSRLPGQTLELEDSAIVEPLIAEGILALADFSDPDLPPDLPQDPPAPQRLVNLNTATIEELSDLPEVGPATANRLVNGRPYSDLAAAQKASKLSDEKWAIVAPLVEV